MALGSHGINPKTFWGLPGSAHLVTHFPHVLSTGLPGPTKFLPVLGCPLDASILGLLDSKSSPLNACLFVHLFAYCGAQNGTRALGTPGKLALYHRVTPAPCLFKGPSLALELD
jgi:uncharacterized RDD family membrane protein YckC